MNNYDDEIISVRSKLQELLEYVRDKNKISKHPDWVEIFSHLELELVDILFAYNFMMDGVYKDINFGVWRSLEMTEYDKLDTKKECYMTGYLDGLKRAKWFLDSFGESIPKESIDPHRRALFEDEVEELSDIGVAEMIRRTEGHINSDSLFDEFLKSSYDKKKFDEFLERLFVHHGKDYNMEIPNPPDSPKQDEPVELTHEMYKNYCSGSCGGHCGCISKDLV